MKQTVLSLFLAISLVTFANGQDGKTFFQTFNVQEINNVEIRIPNEFVIEKWVNQTSILIESTIQLTNIPEAAYRHIMQSGRYDLTELDDEGDNLVIVAKNPDRNIIRTDAGEAVESVLITIYVPEDFELINETTIVRKSSSKAELPKKSLVD